MSHQTRQYLVSTTHSGALSSDHRPGFRFLNRETFFVMVVLVLAIIGGFHLISGSGALMAQGNDKVPSRELLRVVFFDVFQGDAILISTPTGQHILIDGGQNAGRYTTFDGGKNVIIPYLQKAGIKKLDQVIMTHPHADHVGGLVSVLETIPVREVVDPAMEYSSELYKRFLLLAESKGIQWIEAKEGLLLNWGDKVTAQILGPRAIYKGTRSDANNNSVVVRLSFGTTSFLFCGDIEAEAEIDLEDYGLQLRTNVLKVPHHGGEISSSDDFLRLVRPELAVISCGKNNKFGHPHMKTVQRYLDYGSKLFRTDQCGTITMFSDGKQISVSTERDCK